MGAVCLTQNLIRQKVGLTSLSRALCLFDTHTHKQTVVKKKKAVKKKTVVKKKIKMVEKMKKKMVKKKIKMVEKMKKKVMPQPLLRPTLHVA